jgi:hypothetical protein
MEVKVKEQIKEHQQNRKLTSAEIADLFANYLGDSLFACIFEHQLQVVEDDEIRDFLVYALDTSKKHTHMIREIFSKENIPGPIGFGEQDLRKDAPRLFDDLFFVFYIEEMSRAGLMTYGSALTTSVREDIVQYFEMCIEDTVKTYKRALHLLLSKGMDISTPVIPYPSKVDFVEKDSFISLLTGRTRPLTALEIKHLQVNINSNNLGKAFMLAFSQVASSDKLRKYFQEGERLAEKQIRQLGNLMIEGDLPTPQIKDEHITDSTVPPFSDKLMLFHTGLANGIGLQNYGTAAAKIMRHDIHAQFATLTAGIAQYADQGMNLMIELGWLEEPPSATDRQKLANRT